MFKREEYIFIDNLAAQHLQDFVFDHNIRQPGKRYVCDVTQELP